jgi:adenosine kinase
VKIAIAGSVATDHLMTYPGRFTDSLVVGSLDTISLSFLVDDLVVRRGGCAANICFGLGSIGIEPLLVAAVGSDWSDYEAWLERHRVNTKAVKVSTERHTARFLCTTDLDLNQIASFYSGAMSEARDIEIGAVAEQFGGLDLVLIGPDDPDAMLRHTDACRSLGIPFAADPSQQMARMDGDQIRLLVDGAAYFFTNEYERALTTQKTGWSEDEVLSRVGVRITTHGARGAVIERNGNDSVSVGVPKEKAKVDPTGVGDAFRSGFLAGLAWELSDERCGQLGAMLATYVIETQGTQEYRINRDEFLERFTVAYGESASSDIAEHIRCLY